MRGKRLYSCRPAALSHSVTGGGGGGGGGGGRGHVEMCATIAQQRSCAFPFDNNNNDFYSISLLKKSNIKTHHPYRPCRQPPAETWAKIRKSGNLLSIMKIIKFLIP
jgi:hypothetical protein